MFREFNFSQRYTLFTSLLNSIKSNSGLGFHNSDQGHLAYRIGCDEDIEFRDHGDSPERNELFKMMCVLSESLEDCTDFGPDDFITKWSDFCKMATDAYDRHKSN